MAENFRTKHDLVHDVPLFDLMERLECQGVATVWPHPSYFYRTLAGKAGWRSTRSTGKKGGKFLKKMRSKEKEESMSNIESNDRSSTMMGTLTISQTLLA